MGWYGGDGARRVDTVQPSAPLPRTQPACPAMARRVSWTAATGPLGFLDSPGIGAVSGGLSGASLVRTDTEREAPATSSSSYATTRATPTSCSRHPTRRGRPTTIRREQPVRRQPGCRPAYKVSYNRPLTMRGTSHEHSVFNAEYPMVRWLERNGYDVSYSSGVDTDRAAPSCSSTTSSCRSAMTSTGPATQRANVEAARDAGVISPSSAATRCSGRPAGRRASTAAHAYRRWSLQGNARERQD